MPSFRHDAAATNAIVMKSPTKDHAKKFNKKYDLFVGRQHQCTDGPVQRSANCASRPRSHSCTSSTSASERRHVLRPYVSISSIFA